MKIKNQSNITAFIRVCKTALEHQLTLPDDGHASPFLALTILEHELRHTVAEPDSGDPKKRQVSIVRTQEDVTEFVRLAGEVGRSPIFRRNGVGVLETAEWMLRSAVERETHESASPWPLAPIDLAINHDAGHKHLCDVNRGGSCNCDRLPTDADRVAGYHRDGDPR